MYSTLITAVALFAVPVLRVAAFAVSEPELTQVRAFVAVPAETRLRQLFTVRVCQDLMAGHHGPLQCHPRRRCRALWRASVSFQRNYHVAPIPLTVSRFCKQCRGWRFRQDLR